MMPSGIVLQTNPAAEEIISSSTSATIIATTSSRVLPSSVCNVFSLLDAYVFLERLKSCHGVCTDARIDRCALFGGEFTRKLNTTLSSKVSASDAAHGVKKVLVTKRPTLPSRVQDRQAMDFPAWAIS